MKHYYLVPEFGQGFGGIGVFYKYVLERMPADAEVRVVSIFSDCREVNGQRVIYLFRQDKIRREQTKTILYFLGHMLMSVFVLILAFRHRRSAVTFEASDFRCTAWLALRLGLGRHMTIRTHGVELQERKRLALSDLSPARLALRYYRATERIAQSCAENLIFISEYMNSRDRGAYPRLRRGAVIHNPFIPLGLPHEPDAEDQGSWLPDGDRPLQILYFGTISVKKGAKELQKLASNLRGAGRVIACGRLNSDGHRYMSGIDYRGLVSRENLQSIARTCDVVVLPMKHEPFGLTALEAIGLRRPIVYAPSGALPEILSEYAAARACANFSQVTGAYLRDLVESCRGDHRAFVFDFSRYDVESCIAQSRVFYRSTR